MSEESQVSKVTLCVKILKWQSLSQSLTKVRYRAARAAKNKEKKEEKRIVFGGWVSVENISFSFTLNL